MKKLSIIAAAASLTMLAGCNNSPREQAADNIESNAEAVADNLEEAAGNTSGAASDMLENEADAVRNEGDAKAKDMRTHDADTNLSNGM